MEFWGTEFPASVDYGSALRHFVKYNSNDETVFAIKRLAGEQAQLERQWHAGRVSLVQARVDDAKLAEYDQRVHREATEWSAKLRQKLKGLGVPPFKSPRDETAFLKFLGDLTNSTNS